MLCLQVYEGVDQYNGIKLDPEQEVQGVAAPQDTPVLPRSKPKPPTPPLCAKPTVPASHAGVVDINATDEASATTATSSSDAAEPRDDAAADTPVLGLAGILALAQETSVDDLLEEAAARTAASTGPEPDGTRSSSGASTTEQAGVSMHAHARATKQQG